jgi:competence protein ComEC
MDSKKKQIISRGILILLLAVLAIFINQCGGSKKATETSDSDLRSGVVEVHFIDVGQGDSILIEAENAAMLIDAGENNKGSVVEEYLKSQNISRLDYVIGTHPHSDHIGGLDMVINSFPVETVILPDITNTTKTFEDLLNAIEKNNLKITKPEVGASYALGQASFTILAPNSGSYENINDYSISIKLTNGSNSFLFTGDAGIVSEEEMLAGGYDLKADVLKLPHHGSSTGSSADFLDAVNPAYAMISVGKDNEYGHPHVQTLQAVLDRNIKLYRTDVEGTVVFTSDGKNISVNKENYTITDSDLETGN